MSNDFIFSFRNSLEHVTIPEQLEEHVTPQEQVEEHVTLTETLEEKVTTPVVPETSNVESTTNTLDVTYAPNLPGLLKRLELNEFFPQKITKHDVNIIQPNAKEVKGAKSLPWMLLRGIIRLDYRVRDQAVHEFNES